AGGRRRRPRAGRGRGRGPRGGRARNQRGWRQDRGGRAGPEARAAAGRPGRGRGWGRTCALLSRGRTRGEGGANSGNRFRPSGPQNFGKGDKSSVRFFLSITPIRRVYVMQLVS